MSIPSEISALEAKAADTEARVRTAVADAAADIEAEIEAAGPGVRFAVTRLTARLREDLEQALSA